jgi:hypothetical protein
VISSNVDALKFLGLRPDRKIKLFNGSLECSFRKFAVYEGSKRVRSLDEIDEDDQILQKSIAPQPEKRIVKPYVRKENKPREEREYRKPREEKEYKRDDNKFESKSRNEEVAPKKYIGRPLIGKSKYPTPDSNEHSSSVDKSFERNESEQAEEPKKSVRKDDDNANASKPAKYAPKKVITESRQEKLDRLKKGRG